MSILFIKPGISTTVQDLGRHGMKRYGINQCGAMDMAAARILNIILENNENAPVVETYFPAAEMTFEKEAVFAVGGADLGATIDDQPVSIFRRYRVSKGSLLKFNKPKSGRIAYIAVNGGFSLPEHFGSVSTCLAAGFGGVSGRKIEASDRIDFVRTGQTMQPKNFAGVSRELYSLTNSGGELRFIPGAEFDALTAFGELTLLSRRFEVTKDSDRMGVRLAGEPIFLISQTELASAGTAFGTMQLLPNGQIIILMADHQTTGGYPRIGNVIAADLPKLAQMNTGTHISFKPITTTEAEASVINFENELKMLRLGVGFSH